MKCIYLYKCTIFIWVNTYICYFYKNKSPCLHWFCTLLITVFPEEEVGVFGLKERVTLKVESPQRGGEGHIKWLPMEIKGSSVKPMTAEKTKMPTSEAQINSPKETRWWSLCTVYSHTALAATTTITTLHVGNLIL